MILAAAGGAVSIQVWLGGAMRYGEASPGLAGPPGSSPASSLSTSSILGMQSSLRSVSDPYPTPLSHLCPHPPLPACPCARLLPAPRNPRGSRIDTVLVLGCVCDPSCTNALPPPVRQERTTVSVAATLLVVVRGGIRLRQEKRLPPGHSWAGGEGVSRS